jgi:4-diphosphocytidyl-2-C-methyl-D-erythritol kinase
LLTLSAPAKINLTLEVLEKRPDGYHEIRSVLQAVSLCDTISFEPAADILFHCDNPAWEAEKSLVTRAAERLKAHSVAGSGARISIVKDIPLSSGLGGDSSDAAAVLTGLDRLWQIGAPVVELTAIAAALGSDVPFFLGGLTALASGRGETVKTLPGMAPHWVVILEPKVSAPPSKTSALYSRIKPAHFTDGSVTGALATKLRRGEKVESADLFNVFEKVAYEAFSGLKKCRDEFQDMVESPVHLAGAGPSLFAFARDWEEAVRAVSALREKGYEALTARTLK